MAKELKIDLEVFSSCKTELDNAISELTLIQENVAKAMEDLLASDGWVSNGSREFKSKYTTSWEQGINDRKAVMERMSEHIQNAINLYQPVVEEAENLKLETYTQ